MAVQLQKGKTKTKNYAANVDIHGENLEIDTAKDTAFKLKTTKEKKNDRKFSQRKLQLSALRSPRSNCFLVLFKRRMKRNWAEKKKKLEIEYYQALSPSLKDERVWILGSGKCAERILWTQ